MSVTPTPIYPQSPLITITQFTNSTSTSTPTAIQAATTNGAKIEAILVASTDGSSRSFGLYYNVSSTNYLIGTVQIPANAGNSSTIPAINILSATTSGTLLLPLPIDANGNPYIYLAPSVSLTALPITQISSTDVWNIVVSGGTF